MPWFKVDDGLWGHPKWLKTPPAARGLWVTAGSWCADHLTDGHVPRHVLASLGGRKRDADWLVSVGLWFQTDDGWAFHEWADDGRQPTRSSVLEARKTAAERQQRARERARESQRDSRRDTASSHAPPDPTRPVPIGGSTPYVANGPARGAAPPPRCAEHLNDPDPPPCGRCAEARRRRTAWDADAGQRERDTPKCRRHRGQPAHNCALCRAEQLGAETREAS